MLVLVLIGTELAYLVGANLLLVSGLVENAVTDQDEKRFLSLGSAWTIWPGRVHLKDVRLRFQDSNVQLELTVDKAVVNVALTALLKTTFHAKSLEGSGVTFKFRHKVHSAKGKEQRLSAYPSIEGYDDPPLYDPLASTTDEAQDEENDLWIIEFENVTAGISEVWLNEYRYEGPGKVQGAFRLHPTKHLRVSPSELTFDGGRLSFGNTAPISPSFEGTVQAQVESFDVRKPQGREVFQHISGNVRLTAEIGDAGFLSAYFADTELDGGEGRLTTDVTVEGGVLAPSSEAVYRTRSVGVKHGKLAARGDIELSAKVGTSSDGVKISLASDEVVFGAAERTSSKMSNLTANVEGSFADLTGALNLTGYEAKAPALQIQDVAWVNGLLGHDSNWRVGGGPISGSADLASKDGSALRASARLDLHDLEVAHEKIVVRVRTGTLKGSFEMDDAEGNAVVDTLEIRSVSAGPPGDLTDDWWIIANAKVSFQNASADELEAVIRASCKNAVPILNVLGATAIIPGFAEELVLLPNLKLGLDISRGDDRTVVRVRYANSDIADVRGQWVIGNDISRGVFLVGGETLSIGLRVGDDHSGVRLFANDDWLKKQLPL